jgi:hypothetical protein
MNKKIYHTLILASMLTLAGCADNELEVKPNDNNFPFQLIVDTDEGGDLADAEDYGLEIKFADYLGELPSETITLYYDIEGEDSFENAVSIDKVVYEVEIDDCVYERELGFDPIAKTITVVSDPDLGSLPEAFEVVFLLPGVDDTEGTFEFTITDLQSTNSNIIVGEPAAFEYEVLDNEVAGEWVWELTSEDDLESFKEVFGVISPDLADLAFEDILEDDGIRIIRAQFEYGEMKFEIALAEEETVCEEGESETENKQLEIEAEYDAEDGELILEGSRIILNEDDGEIEDELDFIAIAIYTINEQDQSITITFQKIIDEDSYEEGDELFSANSAFTFVKD